MIQILDDFIQLLADIVVNETRHQTMRELKN